MKLFETLTLDSLSSILEVYKPHYQELRKTPGGSVKDWFKAMGVEDEHVKAAMDEARQLDSYKKLASMFTVKFGGALLNKNGTFSFRSANNNSYSVYGNGVIRQEGPRRGYANHFITKLKAPKPALVHGSPVKSLVKIYDNAFKELASKKLRESVEDLNESVNFGKMQQTIYNYVLRKMNGIPLVDAHDLAKNTDTFWVSEFDDALSDLERNDVNSALDSIAIAISAVSEAIVDWYSNKMNHSPGYKPVKLKSIKDVSEKDVMAILNEIDPKMVKRELALQKEEAEKHKALKAQDRAAASSKLSEIASILKKHEAAGWAEFARVIKKATPKTAKGYISHYMPKGTTEEELLAIKNAVQLKAFIKDKSTDVEYVETLVANVENLTIEIEKDDHHLMSLAYVASRDARLSKKLAALVK